MAERTSAHVAAQRMRAAGAEPLEDYPGNNRTPWKCRCTQCGRTITPTLVNATRPGRMACRHCSRSKVGASRSTPSKVAEDAARSVGLEPLTEFPGNSRTPWPCRCLQCGERVTPTLTTINRGCGCHLCGVTKRGLSNRARIEQTALAGLHDAHAEALERYPGMKKPWRIKCLLCGRPGVTSWTVVRRGGAPCSCVVRNGFQVHEPAYVYVLGRQDGFGKFGVTKDPQHRLRVHARAAGFTDLVLLAGPMPGDQALVVERRMKEALARSPKAPDKFNGWTETFSLADLTTEVVDLANQSGV